MAGNLRDQESDDNRSRSAGGLDEETRKLAGRIATGMTQDLGNLFAAILAQVDLAQGSLEIQDVVGLDHDLEDIRLAVLRGMRLVEQMLAFRRGQGLSLQTVDPGPVVDDALRVVRPLLSPPQSVRAVHGTAPAIRADAVALQQIVTSLVLWVRDRVPDSGRIVVRVGATSLTRADFRRRGWGTPGRYASITISDDRSDLSQGELDELFEASPEREGLLLVYALMKQHRGFVDVRRRPEGGTEVELLFRPAPTTAVDTAASAPRELLHSSADGTA